MQEKVSLNSLSIIGLGKVGLCIAVCFASSGYNVIGVDVDEKRVKMINEGKAPFYEEGLEDTLKSVIKNDKLVATTDYDYALERSDITFVVVPTPSNPDGSFSTKYVEYTMRKIAKILKDKNGSHIVVLNSTVMPETMEETVKPLLEDLSRKKCGIDFGLCYNPVFIAIGKVISDILHPDFVLIGESDPNSGKILSDLYYSICKNKPPIARISLTEAEVTKLSVNSFLTVKITFANKLAEICEKIPGIDVDVITSAVGLDSRIGSKFIKGGLGYSGPCFPRDNKAFISLAKRLNMRTELTEAIVRKNNTIPTRISNAILKKASEGHTCIAVLGLTYKPNTYLVDESQSVLIAKILADNGLKVIVHDLMGIDYAKPILRNSVEYASSLEECVEKATIFVLATPWQEYKNLIPLLSSKRKKSVIIDCWRFLNEKEKTEDIEYIAVGRYDKIFQK